MIVLDCDCMHACQFFCSQFEKIHVMKFLLKVLRTSEPLICNDFAISTLESIQLPFHQKDSNSTRLCSVYLSDLKNSSMNMWAGALGHLPYTLAVNLQAIMLYWNLSITLAIIISNAAVHVVWIVIKTFDNPCLMKYCQYLLFSLALLQWHH